MLLFTVVPNGLLVADNAMVSTSIQFDRFPDFETIILPIGEGVAVSRKRR